MNSIGWNLRLESNNALTSLNGLDNLTTINGTLKIYNNDALISLTGIDNIDASSIDDLQIYSNALLSTCEIHCVCDFLASPNGSIEIQDNATGCNSQEEVEAACLQEVDELAIRNQPSAVRIYPNPSTTSITIELPRNTPINNTFLTIFNVNIQQVITRDLTETITVIDGSLLPSGIYLARVSDGKTVMVVKFVKY